MPNKQEAWQARLVVEARIIESRRGKNIYSDFLVKHGRRPDSDQARVMAQLMNARLRDKEGVLQPPKSGVDRAASKNLKIEKKLKAQSWLALSTIADVAQQSLIDPTTIAFHSGDYADRRKIRRQIQTAIEWLTRIDSELQAGESEEAIGAT